jgi:cytosine/adenosine deaminase-related metal-dependent hydrolase
LSDCENERKRELERLRLASDLTQLARDTSNPDLRAHCLRMAKIWSNQALHGVIGNISIQNDTYH